ncbi:MAG: DUF1501 domain-containing protein [Bacteroidota bacterium]
MNRRKFLRYTSASATGAPLLLNSIRVQAFDNPSIMQSLDCTSLKERALVVIRLFGGNDTLNTLVPINQYSTYASLRPTLRVPDSGAGAYVNLDSTLSIADQVGLNPNMTGFKDLYDQGLASFIQGVGYDNHSRSHFKAADLMLSGGDSTEALYELESGWAGRYLAHMYPGLAGYSSPIMPDPLGIQMGIMDSSFAFKCENLQTHVTMGNQDELNYYSLISGIGGALTPTFPDSAFGRELYLANMVQSSTSNYTERINSVFASGSNVKTYPDTSLSNQLKTVARLISGGCQTKIYWVYQDGFDTHADQDSVHDSLLSDLSQSIKAFQDDLNSLGIDDRVLTATVTEFGRKAEENGSGGTDHGTSSSIFLFGKGLKGGMYGTNTDLSNLNDGAPLLPQYDYRQVLATILQDWLGADTDALTATKFEGYENQKLDLIETNLVADPSVACAQTQLTIGEVGSLTEVVQKRKRQWHKVILDRVYENPVVIMGPASAHGGQPFSIRVKNITNNSFKWQVDEWNYLDGGHVAIDISYMVVEAGVHFLPNGKQLIAGITDNIINHKWTNIVFPKSFDSKPLILTQCSSFKGSSAVVTRLSGITNTSFGVRLQEEEGNNGTHLKESVSWVAMEPGTFDDWLMGEGGLTNEVVSHKKHTLDFSRAYSDAPALFASVQTFNGGDPINIRYKSLESEKAVIWLEEEKSQDQEIGHWNRESVGFIVFDKPGQILGDTSLEYNPADSPTFRLAEGEIIEDQDQPFKINCFPNPFISDFLIEMKYAPSKKAKVEIRNILGEVLHTIEDVRSRDMLRVYAKDFARGHYVIRVVSGSEVDTYKILKK